MHEFKVLVRRLHEAGIEVILDVVYNHTAEGNHLGPTLSFRGIDNASYYMLAADRRFYFDTTGCGNTVNLRHPRVLQMVMDSLRYWVEECHVDGFRFDLATSLGREYDQLRSERRLLRRGAAGPGAVARQDDRRALGRRPERLSGRQFPARLGGVERPLPRRHAQLLEGRCERCCRRSRAACSARPTSSSSRAASPGRASTSSPRMTASRSPTSGPTTTSTTRRTARTTATATTTTAAGTAASRGRPTIPPSSTCATACAAACMATLLLSQGTPMILMGDEVGRTQNGNNNAYCQDNEIAWLEWKDVNDRDRAFMEFVRGVIRMRKRYRSCAPNRFLHGERDRRQRHARTSSGIGPTARRWIRRSWGDPNAKVVGLLLCRHDDAAASSSSAPITADPLHAAGARTSPPGQVRIDSGTGEIDPPNRRLRAGRDRSSSKAAHSFSSPGRWGESGRPLVPPTSLATGEGDHAKHGGGGECRARRSSFAPSTAFGGPPPRFAGEEPRAMSEALDRLAIMVGIEPSYFALTGEVMKVSDDAKRAVLEAMGIRAGDEAEIEASLADRLADSALAAGSARGCRMLRAGLAEERPLLGHRLPALFAPLETQLGHRRFRGSRALRRDRRGGGRRLRGGCALCPCRNRRAVAARDDLQCGDADDQRNADSKAVSSTRSSCLRIRRVHS